MKNNLAKSLTITPRSPQPTKETIQRFNTHSTKANPFQSEPILEPESFPRESPKFSRYEADEARKLTSESKKSLKKDSVVLKINLGAQGVKKVRCKIGDDPEELAKSFVSENDLAPDAINVIIKMMKKQLKEMAKRLAEVSKEEGKNENDFSFSPNDLQEEKRIENIVQNPSSESEGPKESSKKKMKLKTLGLLAKLAVKVKPNESKELRIHENEDPTAVVNNFCQENDLSSPARDAIMKNLVKMLRKSKGKPIVAEEPKNEPEPVKNELPAITEPEENLSTEFQTRPTQPDSTQPDEIEDILREKAERYEQWQNLLSEKKEMRLKELDKKSNLQFLFDL